MMQVARTVLLIGMGAIGIAAANANSDTVDDPVEGNVLPADLPRAERLELMKHFAMSLGVRCTHCHVGEEGQPLSTYDFKSDEKQTKRKAREMLKLTHALNQNEMLPGEPRHSLTDMSQNRVTCYTCHRGELTPKTQVPMPEQPAS